MLATSYYNRAISQYRVQEDNSGRHGCAMIWATSDIRAHKNVFKTLFSIRYTTVTENR